jgi:hypothetical protein
MKIHSITVKDLAEILSSYPPDMKVVVEWDASFSSITKDCITVSQGWQMRNINDKFLVIDASDYGTAKVNS